MMKTIYSVCVSLFLRNKITLMLLMSTLFGAQEIFASHAAGADLTYQSIGNNQFIVTYKLYRDCDGITAPTSVSLQYGSVSCGIATAFVTLQQVPGTGYEITRNCSLATSTCNGGSATGIQVYEYSDTVTLPANCPDWSFSYSECCRNMTITTLQNPDSYNLYIDAYLNNTNVNNSSPTFSNPPIAFMCIGQANNFNHGAIDADGDSLVYSFAPPRDGPNDPIGYNPGYSVAHPLTTLPDSFSINPATGDIFLWPTASEIAVLTVMVREYRNGELIGSVIRDIQIYTTACSNTLPDVSGIDGSTTNYSTSSCGGQICFDIITSDGNPGDSLFLTWDQGIPAGTFTISGPYNAPVGHFCWTPTAADARPSPYTFTATIRDNACPSPGTQSRQFSIQVSQLDVTVTSSPSVACAGAHTGTASATLNTPSPGTTYIWSGPGIPSGGAFTPSVNHLTAGNYTVNIIDATGCVATKYFTITEPLPVSVSITPTDAGCNSQFGSAIANPTGGTGAFSYLWSNSATTQTISNLAMGPYSVVVKDANNCSASASTVIGGNIPITATMVTTPATCVANDGTATVTVTGGTGTVTYDWTPNVSTTNSATGLIAGPIECIVTDGGCSITLNEIVGNAAGITATILSSSDATCETTEDGTASVGATGGTMPYSYLWPNGDTTASVNNLAPGTYVVRVEDYHGCRAYASVTIGFVNPSPLIDLGTDTVICNGSSLLLNAGAGFSSYLWSDNSTGQTLAVSAAGTYSVLVTNANGCQNFDAIMVSFVQCPALNNNNPLVYNHNNVQSMTVSPNPFRDQFVVNISRIKDVNVRILVLDVLGNQLFTSYEKAESGYTKNIDLQKYAAGIYLMQVQYNGEMKTVRLVKE